MQESIVRCNNEVRNLLMSWADETQNPFGENAIQVVADLRHQANILSVIQ